MKKKMIEVTFDNVESYVIPFDWYEYLLRDGDYFDVLGMYYTDDENMQNEESIC